MSELSGPQNRLSGFKLPTFGDINRTLRSGDVVLVDAGIRHFDGDGIYVLNTRFGTQIKALQNRGDGLWVVSANPTFPPFPADDTLDIGGKVYVRNRFERLD